MNKNKLTFPDHLAIITTFKDIPLKVEKVRTIPKTTMWNLNKEGGWKNYKTLTTNNAVFNKVASSTGSDSDPNKIIKIIEREQTRIKYASFGKVKYRDTKSSSQILVNLQEKKLLCKDKEDINDVNNEIATELEKIRKENLEKDFQKLNELKGKKGLIAAVFNLKESIVGKKKAIQEATSITDPDTNMEVESIADIKRVSLEYCKTLFNK